MRPSAEIQTDPNLQPGKTIDGATFKTNFIALYRAVCCAAVHWN
jgi:hypothetical protein